MNQDFLRVGACSMAAIPGNTESNITKIKEWCKKAKDEHIDLLLFPELGLSGYWWSTELYYEAQPRNGPAIQDLTKYLNDIDIDMAISVGLAEKYGGTIYNTQITMDRHGERSYYRKTHWPHAEMGTWSCGDRYPIQQINGVNIGTAICYDNNFPEVHRIYGLEGADLVLSPYAYGGKYDSKDPNTIKKAISDWKSKEKVFLQCAAMSNYMWMVACVGGGHVKDYHAWEQNPGKGLEYYFPGVILFIDPQGHVVKESPDDQIGEWLLWTDITTVQNMEARRSNYNHFKDRRIATYDRLTERP